MTKRKMFGISKDLNEGISQTINTVKNNAGQLRYEVIPLNKIQLDPCNPRKLALTIADLGNSDVDHNLSVQKKKELENLKSLANSIKKTGVRNAVEVYKDGVDYRLISGERRVLASYLAGKDDIQARIVDVKPSEYDIRYLQWIENIEREDLTLWERIENVEQLINAYTKSHSVTVNATLLRDIISCSLPHAMTYLAILQAPQDIKLLLQQNLINNLEKAAFLAKITELDTRQKMVAICLEGQVSLLQLKKKLVDYTVCPPKLKLTAKAGRIAKRVTLGYTTQPVIAKKLIELILTQTSFSEWTEQFKFIDWQDCTAVSRAFQHLIKLMESQAN